MGVPISNVTRRVVYSASGTGPYAFTFEILANTDIAVYKDDALLTLTTDYTVTIASNGTGSITLVAAPTGATQIAIVGNRSIQRTTDFVTGGDFFANTVNDEMDQQTIFAQQNAEGLQRALSAPQTDPTSINMTLPRAALRANKALGFDANGNPAIADTLGTNRGNWSASTLYYVRDIVKDTTNSNIWQCIVQHTSSGSQPIDTNADAAKWTLLVDAAAAATSASNAATSASAAATSASAASSSATAASGSASTASTQASNASTSASNAASSASAASSSASTASTAATNAGTSATAAATSATNASNSASAASTSASNASSSASAASTSASNASTSATNAANSASTATTQATNASNSASTASTQATNAASSATAAAASATSAAASYDSFDDRYLGAKSSNPSVDNDGNALLTGAIYFNSVANTMRVYNGSSWQDQAASPDTIAERSFAATAGQTSYTFTGGYRVGYTYVYVNGALLDTADITATDGTTITFTSALSLNDEVRILSYKAIGSVAIGDISGLQTALDAKVALTGNQTVAGVKTFSSDVVANGLTVGRGTGAVATNLALGIGALQGSNSGNGNNIAIGYEAGRNNTTGAYNTWAGGLDFSGGLAVGRNNTTGQYNAGFGAGALANNTTASQNTAVGYQAGYANTTGTTSTFLGALAGYEQTTGTQSTFVGFRAGRNFTTAEGTIAIGYEAGYSGGTAHTGNYNILIGGTISGVQNPPGYSLTTGASNMFIGNGSGQAVTTGGTNTFVGHRSGDLMTTGSKNTILGRFDGNQGSLDIRTASNYIVLSDGDGNPRGIFNGSGDLLLGTATANGTGGVTFASLGATTPYGLINQTASGTLMFFRYNSTTVGSITQNTTSTTYATSSDYRLKNSIAPMTGALAKVALLNPVTYKWNADGSDGEGFIAHELAEVVPDCVTGVKDEVDQDGNPVYQGIDTSFLVATLTAAIQELKAEFDAYKSTHP